MTESMSCTDMYMFLMRDERKKQARSNKAKQHSTLFSRQSALPLSYQGSSAGWAQISHLIVHVHVHVHIGVLCCFALFACLALLASFFLSSASLISMHVY